MNTTGAHNEHYMGVQTGTQRIYGRTNWGTTNTTGAYKLGHNEQNRGVKNQDSSSSSPTALYNISTTRHNIEQLKNLPYPFAFHVSSKEQQSPQFCLYNADGGPVVL
jgi:hypothetical protein